MGVKERRARHHAAIEQRILAAAEALMLRSGAHGVSLRAVAERIEYSPAAIYIYFQTRDELMAALAGRGLRRLNRALTRVSETTDSSALAQLREFYWRYYEFSKAHSAFYELIFLDASYADDQWDREAAEGLHTARALVDRLIAECASAGTLPPETSPANVRRTLWATVHGAAALALRRRLPPDADPDQLVAHALDVVLDGLTARPRTHCARASRQPARASEISA